MWDAFLEGLKQFVRVAVYGALVAFVYTAIPMIQAALGSCSVDSCVFDWHSMLVTSGIAAGVAFVSGIDKWLHELGFKQPLDLNF